MEDRKKLSKTLDSSTSFNEEDIEACSSSSIYTPRRQQTNETLGKIKTVTSENKFCNHTNKSIAQDNKYSIFSLKFCKKNEKESQCQNAEAKMSDTTKKLMDVLLRKSKYSEMHTTEEVQNAAEIVLNQSRKKICVFWGVLMFAAYFISLTSFIGFLYVGKKISNVSVKLEEKNSKPSLSSHFLPIPFLFSFPIKKFEDIQSVLLQLNESERVLYHVSSVSRNLKKNETMIHLQSGESFFINSDESILYDKEKNVIKKWKGTSLWENEANVIFNEKINFLEELEKKKNLVFNKKNNLIDENNIEGFSNVIFNNTYPLYSSTLKDDDKNDINTINLSEKKTVEREEEKDEDLLLYGFPVERNEMNDKVFYDSNAINIVNKFFSNNNNSINKVTEDTNTLKAEYMEEKTINNDSKKVIENVDDSNIEKENIINNKPRRLLPFGDLFNFKSSLLNGIMSTTARTADSLASIGGAIVRPTLNLASANPFSSLANIFRLPYAVGQPASRFAPLLPSLFNNLSYSPLNALGMGNTGIVNGVGGGTTTVLGAGGGAGGGGTTTVLGGVGGGGGGGITNFLGGGGGRFPNMLGFRA